MFEEFDKSPGLDMIISELLEEGEDCVTKWLFFNIF